LPRHIDADIARTSQDSAKSAIIANGRPITYFLASPATTALIIGHSFPGRSFEREQPVLRQVKRDTDTIIKGSKDAVMTDFPTPKRSVRVTSSLVANHPMTIHPRYCHPKITPPIPTTHRNTSYLIPKPIPSIPQTKSILTSTPPHFTTSSK
jgi:hypothetical protein